MNISCVSLVAAFSFHRTSGSFSLQLGIPILLSVVMPNARHGSSDLCWLQLKGQQSVILMQCSLQILEPCSFIYPFITLSLREALLSFSWFCFQNVFPVSVKGLTSIVDQKSLERNSNLWTINVEDTHYCYKINEENQWTLC